MKNANLIRMNKKRNNNFINNNNNNYGNNNNNNFVGIITIITKAEVVLHQAAHIYFLMKLILIQKKLILQVPQIRVLIMIHGKEKVFTIIMEVVILIIVGVTITHLLL